MTTTKATTMTLEDRIALILSPAIDARAPYAKVMIGEIAKLVAQEAGDLPAKYHHAMKTIARQLPAGYELAVDVDGNYSVREIT